MSTEQVQQQVVELPPGVTATLAGRTLSVKGKLGEAKKHFDKVNVNLSVEGNKVSISPFSLKKKDNVIVNTVVSLVNNMVYRRFEGLHVQAQGRLRPLPDFGEDEGGRDPRRELHGRKVAEDGQDSRGMQGRD